MREYEFLKILRKELDVLPEELRDDLVLDFEEHFEEGLRQGKTGEEIAEQLGDPRKIASEYLEQYSEKMHNATQDRDTKEEKGKKFNVNFNKEYTRENDEYKSTYMFDVKSFFDKLFSSAENKVNETIVQDLFEETYPTGQISVIDVTTDLASLEINEVDREDIKVSIDSKSLNKSDFKSTIVGQTLVIEQKIIKDTKIKFGNLGDSKIVVEVPVGAELAIESDVKVGSTKINGDFKTLKVKSQVGTVYLNGDFGVVNVASSVGSVKSDKFSGTGMVKSDIGTVSLNFTEKQKGKVNLQVDMGRIKIDKEKFNNIESNTIILDQSDSYLKLASDMGSIRIL